jgi:hypothetical protein
LEIDASVSRDDSKGAAKAVKHWIKKVEKGDATGNALICWEHGQLKLIAEAVGVTGYGDEVPVKIQENGTDNGEWGYPDNRFDLIWTVREPWESIGEVTSEGCEELDDGHQDP